MKKAKKVKKEYTEEDFNRDVEKQNSVVWSMFERYCFQHDCLLSEKNRELDPRILFTDHQEIDVTGEELKVIVKDILAKENLLGS